MKNLILALFLSLISSESYSFNKVIYPRTKTADDRRFEYQVKLLEEILKITQDQFGGYSLSPSQFFLPKKRRLSNLNDKERVINITWMPSTADLEKQHEPVRIPILKGLLGWRVFFIHRHNQLKFNEIKTLEELKAFTVGQGHDWKDVQVFEANGIPVVESPTYNSLFKMLLSKRFDYFSRGITEIQAEYEARRYEMPDLHIEKSLLMYYPWPYYFFVSDKEPRLKERITVGLEKLFDNGVLDKLFSKYYDGHIKQLNLSKRRLFKIKNPLLPSNVPFHIKKYWLSLDKYK